MDIIARIFTVSRGYSVIIPTCYWVRNTATDGTATDGTATDGTQLLMEHSLVDENIWFFTLPLLDEQLILMILKLLVLTQKFIEERSGLFSVLCSSYLFIELVFLLKCWQVVLVGYRISED